MANYSRLPRRHGKCFSSSNFVWDCFTVYLPFIRIRWTVELDWFVPRTQHWPNFTVSIEDAAAPVQKLLAKVPASNLSSLEAPGEIVDIAGVSVIIFRLTWLNWLTYSPHLHWAEKKRQTFIQAKGNYISTWRWFYLRKRVKLCGLDLSSCRSDRSGCILGQLRPSTCQSVS